MRIVETDNFDGDYPDESFVLRYSLHPEAAKNIAEVINSYCSGTESPRYWKVVDDDYELSPGFTP